MKILVDENIPSESVRELGKAGHDVLDIRGSDKQGADDEALWSLAQTEARLLITTAKDLPVIEATVITESSSCVFTSQMERPSMQG